MIKTPGNCMENYTLSQEIKIFYMKILKNSKITDTCD